MGGGGKYNFPHLVALEAIREARQPTTLSQKKRKDDYLLGVHYTAARIKGRRLSRVDRRRALTDEQKA